MIEGRTDEEKAVYGRADHRGLREHEAGAKAGGLAHKHGVSKTTLYDWKAKYGGMDVSDAKRLKALESVAQLAMRLGCLYREAVHSPIAGRTK